MIGLEWVLKRLYIKIRYEILDINPFGELDIH